MSQPASPPSPLPPLDRPRETPLGVLIVSMALVILPLILISQIAAHARTDVVDDQMFGYFGWRIAHGATVYLDVWDNKPPGIYWINAIGFLLGGGNSYYGVIALVALALITAHAAFFVAASAVYFRGSAAIATVLAAFFLTHSFYQAGTNRTETFLATCELIAAAFYLRAWRVDRWWKWLLAGVFCGLAFLFKQIGLAALAAMGLHLLTLMIMRRIPVGVGVKRGLLILGGAGLVVAAAAGYLASRGALDAAVFATFGFNAAYVATNQSLPLDPSLSIILMRQDLGDVFLLPILMVIAAWIHALLWWLRPKDRPADIAAPLSTLEPVCPGYLWFFALWLLIALYGALIGPGRYRHYIIAVVPPLLLSAGYLINVVKTEIGLLKRMQQRAWVVAIFVAMGYFASEAVQLNWRAVARVYIERNPDYVDGHWTWKQSWWEQIGESVRDHSQPGQTLQCWGYMPGVYLVARRPNVCRFATTEKLGHVGSGAEFVADELHERLKNDPPAVFVITEEDYAWCQIPEDFEPDPNSKFNEFSRKGPGWLGHWLGEWIKQHYSCVAHVRDAHAFVLKRNDLLTPEEKADAITLPTIQPENAERAAEPAG